MVLGALEKLGLTQEKRTCLGQMKVQIPGERGFCSGGGQSGLALALDPGKGEEHFFLFLSPEDVAPTPSLGTQASVLMWPH